jgi:hypothetical protein
MVGILAQSCERKGEIDLKRLIQESRVGEVRDIPDWSQFTPIATVVSPTHGSLSKENLSPRIGLPERE